MPEFTTTRAHSSLPPAMHGWEEEPRASARPGTLSRYRRYRPASRRAAFTLLEELALPEMSSPPWHGDDVLPVGTDVLANGDAPRVAAWISHLNCWRG